MSERICRILTKAGMNNPDIASDRRHVENGGLLKQVQVSLQVRQTLMSIDLEGEET